MKIIKLIAENIKRVKAVEIEPTGAVVKITGKNEQGKSSVLDAIIYGLRGKTKIDKEPLRQGEESGFVEMDLGDYVVTRKFSENEAGIVQTYVKVVSKENAEFRSPQQLLDKFITDLTFDPLEFVKADPKVQRKTLLNIVDFDFDEDHLIAISGFELKNDKDHIPLDIISQYIATVSDKRLEIHRELTKQKKVLEAVEIPEGMEDTKTVSITDLVSERTKLQDKERLKEKIEKERQDKTSNIEYVKGEIENSYAEIEELKNKIKSIEIRISESNKKLQEHVDYRNILGEKHKSMPDVDFTDIDKRISEADETNRVAELCKQRKLSQESVISNQSKHDTFSETIKKLREYNDSLIENVKFPITGLGFSEEGYVTYEGVPLEQAGSSKQIIVGMSIGAALNPDIRVIIIKNGNDLDSDNQKVVEKWAEDNDFQIWMECVADEDDGVSFHIIDGEIATK